MTGNIGRQGQSIEQVGQQHGPVTEQGRFEPRLNLFQRHPARASPFLPNQIKELFAFFKARPGDDIAFFLQSSPNPARVIATVASTYSSASCLNLS